MRISLNADLCLISEMLETEFLTRGNSVSLMKNSEAAKNNPMPQKVKTITVKLAT